MSERWPDWLQINDHLRPLKAYGAPQIPARVKLNTNESPFELTTQLQDAIKQEIASNLAHLNRYPDRDAMELRGLLATFINDSANTEFSAANIWAANGSNEILQSIALAFKGSAMGFEPSYSMHPLIAKTVSKEWISVPRGADFKFDIAAALLAIEKSKPGLVFLTTPNNPTGDSIPLSEIAAVAKAAFEHKGLVVVDEAYAEFSNQPSAVSLLADYPNLIISRTMSKAFAFAGARLGYLIADPIIVEAMLLVRLPYHLSELTQAAAKAALRNSAQLKANVAQLKTYRDELAANLLGLGLQVIPSDANFLLFSGFELSASELWQKLVDRGVLIRDVGIPGYLRVTVGLPEENQAFLSALQESLGIRS